MHIWRSIGIHKCRPLHRLDIEAHWHQNYTMKEDFAKHNKDNFSVHQLHISGLYFITQIIFFEINRIIENSEQTFRPRELIIFPCDVKQKTEEKSCIDFFHSHLLIIIHIDSSSYMRLSCPLAAHLNLIKFSYFTFSSHGY